VPTPASSALAAGFSALLGSHGETLGYIPKSAVIEAETGEAITNETGSAYLSDDTETIITGIIDDEYELGAGYASTAPVATVRASDVVGIVRGAVIVRQSDSVSYYVQDVQKGPAGGTLLLILSKDAQ
jgi:hypothetical protein